jgi:hypothetical protein
MAITKINTPELFDLGTTNSSLRLPSGDTASRPTNPNTGEWRYNTDDNYVEYWDGSAWFQIDYEAAAPTCTTNTINYPTAITAYYKMEDATDQTGNYNGTATNVNFNVAGKFGNAGEFNGSSSYIDTNTTFTPDLMSFSAWVKTSTISPSTAKQIISNRGDAGTNYLGIDVGITPNGNIYSRFDNGGSRGSTNSDTVPIPLNTWTHIAFTIDMSNSIQKVYKNGVFVYQETTSGSIASGNDFYIGRYFSGADYWEGSIDQVRIFPSVLTSDQVTQLYNEIQCAPTIIPTNNFNVNTYAGNGSTQKIDAKFNEAANFNGSSSAISLPSDINTSYVTPNGQFSSSNWVNFNTVGTSIQQIVNFNTTANIEIALNGVSQGAGKIVLSLWDGSYVHLISTTTVVTNTWYHIVVTHNNGSWSLYINGSLEDTDTKTIVQPTSPIVLGKRQNNTQYLNGKLDQVRIYNTALTGLQVTDLYTNETDATAQLLNFPVGAGCIAAYKLDSNADDISGLYSGTPTDIGYTGMEFTPDFVWIKNRTTAASHLVQDSVRGAGQNFNIYPDFTGYEGEYGTYGFISSFNSNGFSVDASTNAYHTNRSGDNYVAWNWKAGGAPTATNSAGAGNVPTAGSVKINGADSTTALAGTIAATSISANTEAGFSVVEYVGTGATASVGHELSAKPELVFIKKTSTTGSWVTFSDATGVFSFSFLNTTNAFTDYSSSMSWNSSVLNLNNGGDQNGSGATHIAYFFHSVDGFSKIGSYVGTGAAGNSVVTGFEPAFVMVKRSSAASNWSMFDNKRSPINPRDNWLAANQAAAEQDLSAFDTIDFTSNGFILQDAGTLAGDTNFNVNGSTYIFMAFAADPAPEPVLANSFNVVTYTGDNTAKTVSVGFTPDFVWIKNRNNSANSTHEHSLFDSLRTTGYRVRSNSTGAENDYSSHMSGFTSGGFNLTTSGALNDSAGTYVAWCWKASNDSTINQEGSITSIVSANPAAGFSVVKYTGNGGSSAKTVGHGLSEIPEIIINKDFTSNSYDWAVYTSATGNTKKLALNQSNAEATSGIWNDTSPTNSVFSVRYDQTNATGNDFIAYCFHSVDGYQKVGSYSGTGVAGKRVYTTDDGTSTGNGGFRPRFMIIKRVDNGTGGWVMIDSTRSNTGNPINDLLNADSSGAESVNNANNGVDFNDDGFTLQGTSNGTNGNNTYIYLAIA